MTNGSSSLLALHVYLQLFKESQVQQPSWPDHFLYDFTVSEDLVSSSLTISSRDVHSLSSCLQITMNSFSVLLLFFQSSPNSAAGSVLSSPSMKWSGDSSPHHGMALWPHFILNILLVTLGTSFFKASFQVPPLLWILSLFPVACEMKILLHFNMRFQETNLSYFIIAPPDTAGGQRVDPMLSSVYKSIFANNKALKSLNVIMSFFLRVEKSTARF